MSEESAGAADGGRSARRRDRGEPDEQHVFRASRRRRFALHAFRYSLFRYANFQILFLFLLTVVWRIAIQYINLIEIKVITL